MKSPLKAIRWLFTFKMSAKQYLAYQTFGSIFVNGGITSGFAWLRRNDVTIPLWGMSGIAFDILQTTFLLAALTVLLGTLFIRRDLKAGRFEMTGWTPRNHPLLKLFPYSVWLRAIVFGPLFTLVFVPPAVVVFEIFGIDSLRYWPFFAFKVLYAIILGMTVTPLNALWVMTRPKRQ